MNEAPECLECTDTMRRLSDRHASKDHEHWRCGAGHQWIRCTGNKQTRAHAGCRRGMQPS